MLGNPDPGLVVYSAAHVTVVSFAGRDLALHEEAAEAVGAELLRLAEGMAGRTIVLRFAGVTYLTSTMLGKVMALHNKLQGVGAKLALRHLRPEVYEVFAAAGLHQILDIGREPAGGHGSGV